MPTDAGVSARGVCVDVCMFMSVCVCTQAPEYVCVSVSFFRPYASATVKAQSIQCSSQPNSLD